MKLTNLIFILGSLLAGYAAQASCTEDQVIDLLNKKTDQIYSNCHIDARFEGAYETSLWIANISCENDEFHQYGIPLNEQGDRCSIPWFSGIEKYR
jgi:hypothetical protein